MAKRKGYRFPTTRASRSAAIFPPADISFDREPEVMLVKGQQVDSKEEYWTSLALDWMRWDYAYQYAVEGGTSRRGGNIIDFLVYTTGRWTMLDPMGRVWHTGRREDRLEMQDVARKRHWKLIAWFTDEIPPGPEATLAFLRSQMPSNR